MIESKVEDLHLFARLFDHAPIGMALVSPEGKLLKVNPSLCKMLGYTENELSALTFQEITYPEDLQKNLEQQQAALEGKINSYQLEKRYIDKSSQVIWCLLSVTLERSHQGHPLFFISQMVDITQRIRDVKEEKQTDEILQQAEKLSLIGELAAGIAHEIRNPLTSLRGFIQLFKSGVIDDKSMHYEIMISEIDRINGIVSELLLLAKPSPETVEFRSMAKELSQVITLLEAESNLFNVAIRRDFEDNLPFIRCQINMRQVFINLLKNSIEAMPKGGEITVQLKRIEDNICIRFIDQGCGISQEQLSRLGQPFFTTKETGTGLGMMISQRIIQTHGGTMQIESQEGKGTTVEIWLPIHGEISSYAEKVII